MKIFFCFIFSSLIFAELNQSYNGFGLDIGKSGSGIFITRQGIHESGNFSINGELRFYDIKASNEVIVYDYFSGQYQSVGSKNLFMIPFFIGANYYLFNGKIENNFSPFLTCRVGGVLSVDGKEVSVFKDRWDNPDTQITPGGFFGLGIDFQMVGQTSVSVMVGYELLPLYRKFDGLDDYSGILIHISFNRRSE
ncbi:MAG: hypothetical protein ACJZ12_02645 [Candidatus Neomarinimicrobiota bacterium]